MAYEEIYYPEFKFGGFADIDGTIAFYNRVNSLLDSSFTVLDVGCGRGAFDEDPVGIRRNLRIFKGKVLKVIGIDVDSSAKKNPFIDEFHTIQGSSWPIENESIDLIVCDNVLEHMDNPDNFFSEANRVLKNGGYLCIRTPNLWNYIGLFARFIPNKYHSKIIAIVSEGRKKRDIFPKFFRCNSIRKLKYTMSSYNFESVVYGYEADPSYLSFSRFAYWFGVLHQRFAPSLLRAVIFAFGKVNK